MPPQKRRVLCTKQSVWAAIPAPHYITLVLRRAYERFRVEKTHQTAAPSDYPCGLLPGKSAQNKLQKLKNENEKHRTKPFPAAVRNTIVVDGTPSSSTNKKHARPHLCTPIPRTRPTHNKNHPPPPPPFHLQMRFRLPPCAERVCLRFQDTGHLRRRALP